MLLTFESTINLVYYMLCYFIFPFSKSFHALSEIPDIFDWITQTDKPLTDKNI